ncbi:MAG TPA: Crp/Fnr family transcriptional regulator [Bacteroidia bacterium]
MNEVLEHFSKYIQVSPELEREIMKRVHLHTFKKGELIHDARNICIESFFIREGILRTYFIKDGKEITEYFSTAGEWTNSPKSFMQRKLDIYSIDAIEDTKVFRLNVEDLVYLFHNFPEMDRYARLSMGTLVGHLLERITSLRFTSAKEKYDHFRETYHDIYHRVPLNMIASYLGISPETLSRLRAEK